MRRHLIVALAGHADGRFAARSRGRTAPIPSRSPTISEPDRWPPWWPTYGSVLVWTLHLRRNEAGSRGGSARSWAGLRKGPRTATSRRHCSSAPRRCRSTSRRCCGSLGCPDGVICIQSQPRRCIAIDHEGGVVSHLRRRNDRPTAAARGRFAARAAKRRNLNCSARRQQC